MNQLLASLNNIIEHIHSEDLVFRPLARCDAFALFEATQDRRMNEHLRWSTPQSVEETLIQIEKFHRAHRLGQIVATSICMKKTGEWLGYLNFAPFRDGMEVSLGLSPKTWGTRMGGGVVGDLVPQIIEKLDPNLPLYMRVIKDNARMYRLCVKMGCEKVDEFADQYDSGAPLQADILKLNREKWNERKHLALQEF